MSSYIVNLAEKGDREKEKDYNYDESNNRNEKTEETVGPLTSYHCAHRDKKKSQK